VKEKIYLRCCKCNAVFLEKVETNEKIYEINCPICTKQTVEIDLGHRFKEKIINEPRERYYRD
jgi:Zn finger protein HypA/HybF involved in hydrogenase expression